MSLWQRLDPRNHLGAAISWAVFYVVMLCAIGAGAFAAAEAKIKVRGDSERLLVQFATAIDHSLALSLETRRQIISAAAAQIGPRDFGQPALRQQIKALQRQFPEFEWMGIADDRGRVIAATGDDWLDQDNGQDISVHPWFRQANPSASGTAITEATSAALARGPSAVRISPDAIELSAPILNADGHTTGIVAATVSWLWIDRLKNEFLSALDDQRRPGLRALLAAHDGTVLSGPDRWRGHTLSVIGDLSEGGAFLVGRTAGGNNASDSAPTWTIVVRQETGAVIARAQKIGNVVFVSVLGAGLLSALIAVWSVRMLIRRLARLAEQAQALQHGGSVQLEVPIGRDEVSRIGAVLTKALDQLQREKQALADLNTELEQRVTERTARIERLADDARHAAVMRERLRLARDLHDTLAHSMMALLTQIRLVRKLRTRWDEAELEEELERAEAVAASGLTEARAAINQMRHNSVREAGLGAALQELTRRFRERTGLVVTLRAEEKASGLASEYAETAFRIVEEALYNVEHHAQAYEVHLSLDTVVAADRSAPNRQPVQRVRIEVSDDGVGFDTKQRPPGHFGLRGMEEQAALMGAQLAFASRAGCGTRVVLEFDFEG